MNRAAAGSAATLVSASGRVRAVPPSRPGGYWRLSIYDEDGLTRIGQSTAGRSEQRARQRLAEEDRRLTALTPAASAEWGRDLFDFVLDPARPKFPDAPRHRQTWSPSYQQEITAQIDRGLRPVFDDLRLASWAPRHAYRALDRCSTNYNVRKLRRTLSSVIGVGVRHGFLRPDQADIHRVVVPLRADRRPARDCHARRRDQPNLLLPGEVPGCRQVQALAEAGAAARIPGAALWPGFVYTAAYGGLRQAEAFALSADEVSEAAHDQLLTVNWQVIEVAGGGRLRTPPKNGHSRLAVICAQTPQGFPLWSWLQQRATQARKEQQGGRNPHGLIFPAPRGGWWSASNFRSRCFLPAATAAGWARLAWRGPVRRRVAGRWRTEEVPRWDFRHPLHALRHHYATTAVEVWGWTVAELCASGGWADEAFVMTRYYGSTPDTYLTALRKQRHQAAPPRSGPGS